MPYNFLDDIAIADIAFEAWGETLEEMFESAADASMNVMISDLESIRPQVERGIDVESDTIDMLLFSLLQELIFFKDAERLLLRVGDLKIGYGNGAYSLKATARGEEIDPARHDMIVDVKAVTLHRFRVEQTSRGWEAMVILDI